MHFMRFGLRRVITLTLILLLISNQTLAATVILPQAVNQLSAFLSYGWPEWKASFRSVPYAGQGNNVLIGVGKQRPAPKAQETQSDRDRRIVKVSIHPGDVTATVGETIQFSAVARDGNGMAIPGAIFTWSGNDQGRNRSMTISQKGEFIARVAGEYQIHAQNGVHQDQVKVTVTGGDPRGRAVRPQRVIDVSSRDLPKVSSLNPSNKPTKPAVKQTTVGASFRAGSSFMPAGTGGKTAATPKPSAALLPDPTEWNETNIQLADDPGRERGPLVPNRPSFVGAGSGNFSFSAPLVSMAGRGLNLSLALNYNSRLWNRVDGDMVFNLDKDWPSPGFSLGFGKIIGTGDVGGYMIIEADGLHRSHQGRTALYADRQEFTARTVDGSFIDYIVEGDLLSAGGAPRVGRATHPNGTIVQYGARGQDCIYPTRITDASGNYLTIAYRNNSGPQIDRIADTVGREVIFHYDSSNRLTAITAAGLSGNSIFEIARFHYKTLTLNPSFPGLTIRVPNNNYNIEVLDAIYYPSTGSGFWFGDTDSYSSYGMLAKVVEQRGMTFSSTSLNFQGVVSSGQMSRQSVYNLPLQPTSLSDTPLYTTRTDTWAGMDSAPAVTTYFVQVNANPRTFTVIAPDGVKTVQASFNNSGQYNDGVLSQQTVYPTSGASLSTRTSTTTWGAGLHTVTWYNFTADLIIPRPTRIESSEASLPMKVTEFGYTGGLFNQVTSVREYDYTGALARTTTTEYENSSAYVNRHVFNLVKAQEVFTTNGTRASRTEFRYDEHPLQPTSGVVRHTLSYNPYAPDEYGCGEPVPDPNDPDCQNPWCEPFYPGSPEPICNGICSYYTPCGYYPVFDSATLKRGNVTSIVRYADAANLSGAITETRKYDVTGNLISVTDSSCCQQTSFQYTLATQFAYPVSQTRGAISDTTKQVRTSAIWDLWTGLVLETRDGDNNLTTVTYNTTTLRPETIFLPTGAYTYSLYQDANLTAYERAYGSDGVFIGGSDSYLSGIGQTRAQVNYSAETAADVTAGNYQIETVKVEYDSTGRVVRQSRPYRVGETPVWSLIRYDWAGRPDRITAPDGSVSQSFYDERTYPSAATQQHGMTVRSVDAWGRERWARTDALGRMVEVLEPNPNGNGTVTEAGALRTEYLYDALNQIKEIWQGAQARYFKHDSLGRLVYQKLAEQDGAINEAGGAWSGKFEYDTRSNLIRQTDARGVVTNFNYNGDPLNRLQSVSYTVPAAMTGTIAPAATVTYQYVTTGDITRLQSVTDGMGSEVYGYDGYGRLTQVTRNLTGRSPLVTNYDYDSFSRLKQTTYPARYGQANSPRSVVAETYRIGGTLKDLKVDGANVASQFQYNAANQVKTMTLGNGAVETFTYDNQTGLLTGQSLTGAGQSLLNLTYGYNGTGAYASVKTGQITSIADNLAGNNGDRNRTFQYDKLGRLTGANGTRSGAAWSQSYVYDRYGNRQQVIASGALTAQLEMPELPELNFREPQPPTIKDQVAYAEARAISSQTDSRTLRPPASITDANIGGARTSSAASAHQINRPPVCVIGGPYSGTAGSSISFNGSASYDPDGTIVSYIWNFGDNTAGSNAIIGHTYSAPGTYTVTLTVRDNRSASRTCSTTATVTGIGNQSPVANPGGPYNGTVGSAIIFNGSASSDSDGTITAYNWSFGDGTTATGVSPGKSYSTAGTYTVLLTVTDNQGATHSASTTATIASGGTPPNYEGYFDGANCDGLWGWAADRNRLNTSINVDIYDGSTLILANVPANQSRPDVGSYLGDNGLHGFGLATPASLKNGQPHSLTVKFAGTSQSLTLSPRSITCTTNQSPTARPGGPYSGTVGAAISFNGSTSSDPDGTIAGYSWNFGDGTTATGATPSKSYSAAGTFTVTLTVTDNQGATNSATTTATISATANQPPVARPGGPYSGTVGMAISFNGSTSSDPDGTIANYSWNFGDGTTATGAVPNKSYSAAGTFTVTLTVTDNQGATNSGTTTATISSAPGGTLTDGAPSLSHNTINNRISTAGYQYDAAGNLTRGQAENGIWQRYQYDAANRLVTVMNDSSGVIVANSFGADNGRLKSIENGIVRWYGWDGGQTIVEYSDNGSSLVWAKSYVYIGGRLLLTDEPIIGRQYHHADRLGTRIVTSASGAKLTEQATLPFGTALGSPETTGTPTNRRFTSYERSGATKLDYAVNRTYASWQGRFTQVDPIGMGAVSPGNPQSLNLYGYVENDPVNFVDPTGLNKNSRCLKVTFTCVDDGFGGKECGYDWYWDKCDDGGGMGGGGSVAVDYGGGIGSESTALLPLQRPSICDKLEKEIEELVNRDKRKQGGGGTHGLVHRFREQIWGANGPGTDVWETHDEAIKNQQKGLRDRLNEWNKNNCGPPPPKAWDWASKPTPQPNEWIGNRPRAVPVIPRTPVNVGVKVGAGAGAAYVTYRVIRFLPSLIPALWPTIGPNLATP